ncbi:hypothetical protein Tco_1082590 [Tanacetum coccineum]|uniref:Uncharacterized protein n=1 Tax=Tanacetum coccineum TaxID=301880 RepID=A0ABQ5I0Y4_9ASTR
MLRFFQRPSLYKTLLKHLYQSFLEFLLISSTVSEDKGNALFGISRFVCLRQDFSSIWTYTYNDASGAVRNHHGVSYAYMRRIYSLDSRMHPRTNIHKPLMTKAQSAYFKKRDVGFFGGKLIQKLRQKGVYEESFQDMLYELGEVNLVHAYYNGSCTSKDMKDPPSA